MQVKKFEARTMKEALEMVKKELGPDAVILSARDNKKGFGIAGEVSVEITAAVSEVTLRKKQFTESKLVERDRQKFQDSTARQQKDLIDKMVNNQIEKAKPRPVTAQRYIEIDQAQQEAQQQPKVNTFTNPGQSARSQSDISNLHNEIVVLKKMISQFQNVPQAMNQMGQFKSPELQNIYLKLCDEGMNALDAHTFVLKAQESLPQSRLQDKGMIEGWIARAIMDQSLIATDGLDKKVHVFWGPPGVGKTTTIVKMAAQIMRSQGKKIALVTMDTLKVGATEQLKIYAQILNAPFAILKNAQDWKDIMSYADSVDYIFVDSPGPAIQLRKEAEYCQKILGAKANNQRYHLVLSAAYPREKMFDLINRSEVFSCDDLIVTHLDERQHFGAIYSLMLELALPLHSFGLGIKMPDDFEMATRERVLDLIFHITNRNSDEFMRG